MNATQAIEEQKPTMTAAEVAALVGVGRRSIERAAKNPNTPYFAARIVDGIESLRFRRAEIERIIKGEVATAKVLPLKGRR
jgi:hypothetical protein